MQVSSELLKSLNFTNVLCPPSFDDSPPHLKEDAVRKRPIKKRIGTRVLMVGLLRELALYRAEVLRNHGYSVIVPETMDDVIRVIQVGDLDAAVLSYTLPNDEVQELAELVRECCPNCRIIAISDRSRVERRVEPEPDAIVIAQEGPPGLIKALRRIFDLPH